MRLRTLARAALRPLPLVLLAGGAAAGALVAWPLALAGAGTALAAAFLSARGEHRPAVTHPREARRAIRTLELMAHVVRIRKAHEALHGALGAARGTTRDVVAPAYDRICQLIEQAYDLAERADDVRVRLDSPGSARDERPRLEEEYRRASGELVQAATGVERWVAELERGEERGVTKATQGIDEELRRVRSVIEEIKALGA